MPTISNSNRPAVMPRALAPFHNRPRIAHSSAADTVGAFADRLGRRPGAEHRDGVTALPQQRRSLRAAIAGCSIIQNRVPAQSHHAVQRHGLTKPLVPTCRPRAFAAFSRNARGLKRQHYAPLASDCLQRFKPCLPNQGRRHAVFISARIGDRPDKARLSST